MSKTELPVDWDHFHVLLEGILHRVPSMGNAVLERLTNGPEPFSADGNWILGHAPEVESTQAFLYVFICSYFDPDILFQYLKILFILQIRNYFVASGMRSIGVGAAGGVAEVIASYISKGLPSFDVYNLDIQV